MTAQKDDDAPTEAELQDAVNERLIGLSETLPAPLRTDSGDLVAELGKLLAALVGGPAGAFSDYFGGKLFPRTMNSRLQGCVAAIIRRVEAHNLRLRRVERRIEDLGAQHDALFQEGLDSAERATSSERVEIIGAIVGDGLSGDELEAEFERAHIRLLSSLTDRDVTTLRLVARPNDRPDAPPWGPDHARQVTYGRAIEAMSGAHLRNLGLIDEALSLEERPRLGALPPRPILRRHPTKLTPLGQSLLIRLKEGAAPVPGPPEASALDARQAVPTGSALRRSGPRAPRSNV